MSYPAGQQPSPAPSSAADAVRRILTTAGITGAALTLSAAAALPVFACHGGGKSSDSQQSASGQSAHQSKGQDRRSHDSSSQDNEATKTSSEHSDASKGHSHSDNHPDSDKGDKGANTDEGHNPPGNNGTVKIHQTAGDSSPHNQPHVTCSFYVSFFGFDANQVMDISFAGQAPTGKDVPIAIEDAGMTSKTSTTDAGGAGNDYDGDTGAYDASNLDLSGLGAPAKQGYHIKLDVATHEPGGHKYKVFWFMPCTSTPGGGTTGGTTGGGTTGGDTGGTTGGTTGGGTLGGTTGTGGTTPEVGGTGAASGQGTTVLGESFTKGATASGAPAGTAVLGTSVSRGGSSGLGALPFTGAEVGAMSALGLAAIGGGAALTVAGRRRRRAAQSH